mmetsp:Transcript_6264/g.23540  ORF Transcript_6264/g.23540 Transcript_6264/m.23540 type:complete len:665 (-) Transcript_6264:2775-4769(-)
MRSIFLLLVLQLLIFQAAVRAGGTADDDCLSDYPDIQVNSQNIVDWNGNEYKFFDEPCSWDDAEAKCEVFGGNLLTVLNTQENELAKLMTDKICWLGTRKENYWGWIDRSPFTFSSWLDDIIPDALTDACGLFNWNHYVGKWNGVACYNRYPFICKRQKNNCPWGTSRTGAPSPVVSTTFDFEDNLEIRVEMARKNRDGVDYALRFEPVQVSPRTCSIASNDPLIDPSMWTVHQEACSIVFKAKMSLQDFIDNVNPSITSSVGSDFLLISKKLRMVYLDRSEKNSDNSVKCNAVEFDTTIDIKTILLADSSVQVEVEGDTTELTFPPSFISLSQNNQGKLVVDVVIEPDQDDITIRGFMFDKHSRDIDFTCYYRDYCTDSSHHSGCKYRLTCISKERHSDYSGNLSVKTSYLNKYNEVKQATIQFKLMYALVEKPDAVLDVIRTSSKLVESDLSGEVSVVQDGETVYLLTQTSEPLQVSQAEFKYDDVFLCCTKDMQPLKVFNPSEGQMGCTVRNDDTMSFWTKLVSDGQPQSSMDVVIRDMGPFVKDKIALEFKPNGLEGDDKLCYIHAKTALSLQSHARTVQPEEEYTLDSSVPVTFKSCSSHANRSGCTASRSCIWKSESKVCTNRYVRRLNSSSGARIAKSSFGVLLVVFVGVLSVMITF